MKVSIFVFCLCLVIAYSQAYPAVEEAFEVQNIENLKNDPQTVPIAVVDETENADGTENDEVVRDKRHGTKINF
jgi:hypothetical protein